MQATHADPPAISREADGSFVIHRAILAEPVPLEQATDGLIVEFETSDGPEVEKRQHHTRPGSRTIDRALAKAFEEAIDGARSAAQD